MMKLFTICGAFIGFVFAMAVLTTAKGYGPPEAGKIGLRDVIFVCFLAAFGGGAGLLTAYLGRLLFRAGKSIFRTKK